MRFALVALLVAGCGNPQTSSDSAVSLHRSQSTRTRPNAGQLVVQAHALLDQLRHGQLPAATDTFIANLQASAETEGTSTRAREVLHLAADLLAARFQITRDPQDASRADELYTRLAAMGGPPECAALAAAGAVLLASGQTAAARNRYLAYERQCPQGPELAHVHATLARIDPAVARAEAEAGQIRQTGWTFTPARPATTHGRIRRIVIDPGHGGSDPGARSPGGLSESTVTLDVARRLAQHVVTSMGAEVILTRDADEYVPLETRAERANASGADLFVSIHCNSSDNPNSRGVSTYVLDTTSDAVAARVAARENGAVSSDPLADPEVFRILADLRLVGQGSRSTVLAYRIQRSIMESLRPRYPDLVDLGVHPARFHVLIGVRMPAVLVELSFLSNPVEEQRLRDPNYRDALARAIARALAQPGV